MQGVVRAPPPGGRWFVYSCAGIWCSLSSHAEIFNLRHTQQRFSLEFGGHSDPQTEQETLGLARSVLRESLACSKISLETGELISLDILRFMRSGSMHPHGSRPGVGTQSPETLGGPVEVHDEPCVETRSAVRAPLPRPDGRALPTDRDLSFDCPRAYRAINRRFCSDVYLHVHGVHLRLHFSHSLIGRLPGVQY